MKKLFFIPMLLLSLMFIGCTNDLEDAMPQQTTELTKATTVVTFNIATPDYAPSKVTRAASLGDNWPSPTAKSQAETVVKKMYSNKMFTDAENGVLNMDFVKTNYTVSLVNSTTNSSIVGSSTNNNGWSSDAKAELSLEKTNKLTINIQPTAANNGKLPKFKEITTTLDLSKVDIDNPRADSAVVGNKITVKSITTTKTKDGDKVTAITVNVVISVTLDYDSYLLVAPNSSWSILSSAKGFNHIYYGKGTDKVEFNTASTSDTDLSNDWFYYWGSNATQYVYGEGNILTYGFNLYADGSGTPISIEKGHWYALFASINSAGTDDTGSSTTNHVEIGGDSGINPTTNDVAGGQVIR